MRLRIPASIAAVSAALLPIAVSAASALDRLNTVGSEAFPGQRARTAPQVAGDLIAVFLGILGVFFLVLTVYGGYLWMNARGNEQQVEKAKNLITQAVIGLIIILAGYTISTFVVGSLVNATNPAAGAAT